MNSLMQLFENTMIGKIDAERSAHSGAEQTSISKRARRYCMEKEVAAIAISMSSKRKKGYRKRHGRKRTG